MTLTAIATKIVIYDLVTGRVAGGHQEDYLLALEDALNEFSPLVAAPYRVTPDNPVAPRPGKAEQVRQGYRAFRAALNTRERTLILAPNPTPLDFVIFLLAALTRRRSGRGIGVFVMRRDATGIVGPGWKARILDAIVRYLVRLPCFFMVSDARAAMDYWRAVTGCFGPIVTIPIRKAPQIDRKPRTAPTFGLLGLFRIEKGGAHYGAVIEAVTKQAGDARIVCQLSHSGQQAQEEALADQLVSQWHAAPQVTFHRQHLNAAAFAAMLHDVDIVVLPYDVARYGTGTSGILFEAVAAGKIVLAAPITWAVQEYDGHPHVAWLHGTGGDALSDGITRAMAAHRLAAAKPAVPVMDNFRQSWLDALAAAP